MAPGTIADLRLALPGRGSRRASSGPAATAARSRSAGTVFETATSVTSAGVAPGARAGLRDRGRGPPTVGRERRLARSAASNAGERRRRGGTRCEASRRRASRSAVDGLLAAEEARNLEVVGVVRGGALDRHRLADRPSTRGAIDRRGPVAPRGRRSPAVARLDCAGARAPRGSRARAALGPSADRPVGWADCAWRAARACGCRRSRSR